MARLAKCAAHRTGRGWAGKDGRSGEGGMSRRDGGCGGCGADRGIDDSDDGVEDKVSLDERVREERLRHGPNLFGCCFGGVVFGGGGVCV